MCDLPLDEDHENEEGSDIDDTSTRHQGTSAGFSARYFTVTTIEPL